MDVASELARGRRAPAGALARVAGDRSPPARGAARRVRGSQGCRTARARLLAERGGRGDPRRLPRPRGGDPLRPRARGGRGPAAGPVRSVVRAVPPVPEPRAEPPTAPFRRLHRAAAGDRGHGLRRRLSAADPPDRAELPEGAATTRSRPDPTTRAPRGPSATSRRAQGDRPRARAPWPTSGRFLRAAREHGLEVALDYALQCSPDHPWVTEHPEWFHHRPDGTIKYAENPPKKYQDIYPLNFYGRRARGALGGG